MSFITSDASRDEILTSPAAKSFDVVVMDNYSTGLFSPSGQLVDLSQKTITETFGTEMSARAIASLNLFKQAGFSLALDDFGAGYTSLLQLMKYPVDVIKIDKSLIDHVLADSSTLRQNNL